METSGDFNEAFIAGFLLNIVALVLGVVLLCNVEIKHPNQRIILINRAICQILSSTIRSIALLIQLFCEPGVAWLRIELFMDSLFFIVNRILTIHIIIDHILRIKCPIKYNINFPEDAVIQVDGGLWILGKMFALCILISANTIGIVYNVYKAMSVILLSIDIIIIILSTYLCILKYLHANTTETEISEAYYSCRYERQRQCSKVKSWPVIFNFVIFIFPSELMHVLGNYAPQYSKAQMVLFDIGLMLIVIGYIADAATYILVHQELREVISARLRLRNSTKNRETNINREVFC